MSLTGNSDDEKPEPRTLPRTWDKQTLLRSVGWLRYQNSQGRNTYIRPKGEHPLSMVNDLTAEAIQQMKQQGFEPCVIVETSPGNFQAWLNHGKILPKAESTLAARLLAQRFGGDQGAADWRHFGRLADFTNRKEKCRQADGRYPFVRLIEADARCVYSQAEWLTATTRSVQCRDSCERLAAPISSPQNKPSKPRRMKTIEDFRSDPKNGGDQNRIDLAFAIYAITHGIEQGEVRKQLSSRDLAKKGCPERQQHYIARTIRKAQLEESSNFCRRQKPKTPSK